MRLICPNCGAQYEVADDVIPEAGRDVQCSNCGHTWFETPGASAAAEEAALAPAPVDAIEEMPAPAPEDLEELAEPEEFAPETAFDDLETQLGDEGLATLPDEPPAPELPADPAPEAPAPETAEAEAPVDDLDTMIADETPEAEEDLPSEAPPVPPRKPLDTSIADILREEAAREEAQRQAEADAGIEAQTDMGLDDIPTMTPQKQAEAEARINRLKGEEGVPPDISAAVAATVAASRSELLPDIEEINDTLRPDAERDAPPPPTPEEEAEERRGFRFGFFSMLILIGVLAGIYVFADDIAAAVPALSGILDAYVVAIDKLRIWFDVQMQKLLVMVEGSDAAEGTDATDG